MGIRRQAREAAVQALYMCDTLNKWDLPTVDLYVKNFDVAKNVKDYATILCLGVLENISFLDAAITRASEHWSISRMGRVDRALLRVAGYELLISSEIPKGVAINEAIEVAKKFSAEESPNFINGVLDKIAASNNQTKIEPAAIYSKPEPELQDVDE